MRPGRLKSVGAPAHDEATPVVATDLASLNGLLTRFVSAVRQILGGNLVGVYLTGSFALDRGDAASDCDFLVATGEELGRDEERSLRHLHEEVLGWPCYWAYNLEGSYAPKADLQTLGTVRRPWLYVNRGRGEMEWSGHCNTEEVRWVLANCPRVLAGTDPREFVCEVPAAVLQATMRPQIENFLTDLKAWAPF